MKVFRNLQIEIEEARCAALLDALERHLDPGWKRARKQEEDSPGMGTTFRYFVCERTDTRPAALVALVEKRPGLLYVSNVVPRDKGELSFDEYNAVLEEFADRIVDPAVKEVGGGQFRLSSTEESLDDWVSPDTASKLRRFSMAANKSTGSSHPCDKERWFEFIIAVVLNGDDLSTDDLGRWLVEEQGWPEDVVDRLVVEYEQQTALLCFYRSR